MDAVAELPAEIPPKAARKAIPHAFTRENAVEMQRRAQEAIKARIARQKAETEAARLNPHSEQPKEPQRCENDRATIVAEQIVRTRKELNKTLEPRERAQLLCALDKLLDRERILLAVPLPGSRRPGRETPSKRSGEVVPVE